MGGLSWSLVAGPTLSPGHGAGPQSRCWQSVLRMLTRVAPEQSGVNPGCLLPGEGWQSTGKAPGG